MIARHGFLKEVYGAVLSHAKAKVEKQREERERERERDASSAVHLSQPFLARPDFCLFTALSSPSLIVAAVSLSASHGRRQPLVLFTSVLKGIFSPAVSFLAAYNLVIVSEVFSVSWRFRELMGEMTEQN